MSNVDREVNIKAIFAVNWTLLIIRSWENKFNFRPYFHYCSLLQRSLLYSVPFHVRWNSDYSLRQLWFTCDSMQTECAQRSVELENWCQKSLQFQSLLKRFML